MRTYRISIYYTVYWNDTATPKQLVVLRKAKNPAQAVSAVMAVFSALSNVDAEYTVSGYPTVEMPYLSVSNISVSTLT